MSIVNLEELEKAIVGIENLLSEYNEIEKDMIITQITARRMQAKQKQKAEEAVQNVSIKGLLKKITRVKEDGDG